MFSLFGYKNIVISWIAWLKKQIIATAYINLLNSLKFISLVVLIICFSIRNIFNRKRIAENKTLLRFFIHLMKNIFFCPFHFFSSDSYLYFSFFRKWNRFIQTKEVKSFSKSFFCKFFFSSTGCMTKKCEKRVLYFLFSAQEDNKGTVCYSFDMI